MEKTLDRWWCFYSNRVLIQNFVPSLSCVVLSRPNVPPVSVLNKMFPDLPQKTAETLTLIEYESLKEESRQALQDRHLALNNSAAARLTEVILWLNILEKLVF